MAINSNHFRSLGVPLLWFSPCLWLGVLFLRRHPNLPRVAALFSAPLLGPLSFLPQPFGLPCLALPFCTYTGTPCCCGTPSSPGRQWLQHTSSASNAHDYTSLLPLWPSKVCSIVHMRARDHAFATKLLVRPCSLSRCCSCCYHSPHCCRALCSPFPLVSFPLPTIWSTTCCFPCPYNHHPRPPRGPTALLPAPSKPGEGHHHPKLQQDAHDTGDPLPVSFGGLQHICLPPPCPRPTLCRPLDHPSAGYTPLHPLERSNFALLQLLGLPPV